MLLLAAAVLLSIGIGAVRIAPEQVLAILADRVGIDLGVAYRPDQEAVLWSIRLPRVVLGVLVGGARAPRSRASSATRSPIRG